MLSKFANREGTRSFEIILPFIPSGLLRLCVSKRLLLATING
jgi:hypothetical protein